MTAAYQTAHSMDAGFNDGGSDDSEIEVWDETEVAAVETSIRESARSSHESVTQWGNAYFRPGTAPEAPPPPEPLHPLRIIFSAITGALFSPASFSSEPQIHIPFH